MHDVEPSRRRFWLGSAAALLSAVAFSANVALSKLAFNFGTNLHALNLVRATVFFLLSVAGGMVIWRTSLYKAE